MGWGWLDHGRAGRPRESVSLNGRDITDWLSRWSFVVSVACYQPVCPEKHLAKGRKSQGAPDQAGCIRYPLGWVTRDILTRIPTFLRIVFWGVGRCQGLLA